jgi:glycoprotein endo-alpha-1,2-mannosidase
VGPGYIDTGVRPWNGETSRQRYYGNYYRDGFKKLPRDNDNIISITSFNEWHEGTQIEPAIEKTVSKTNTYERYEQGPFMYIDLTRKLIFGTKL